jgi:dTDP-4-dehydrorhamnose 3,5-epimerase-like enzyme
MKTTTVKNVKFIDLPRRDDPRGSLCFAEEGTHVPFHSKRFFYIFGVPENMARGGHAHKRNEQMHICVNGSLTVTLDDGTTKEEITLSDPGQAMYVGPLVWHTMKNFSPETVLLVLNSEMYSEEEYLRSYEDFLAEIKK